MFVHGHGRHEFHFKGAVVAGHDQRYAFGEFDGARHVRHGPAHFPQRLSGQAGSGVQIGNGGCGLLVGVGNRSRKLFEFVLQGSRFFALAPVAPVPARIALKASWTFIAAYTAPATRSIIILNTLLIFFPSCCISLLFLASVLLICRAFLSN